MHILYFLILLVLTPAARLQSLTLQTTTDPSSSTSTQTSNSASQQNIINIPQQTFNNDQFTISFDNSLGAAVQMDSNMKCSRNSTAPMPSTNMISLDSITLTYSQYLQNFKRVPECSLTQQQRLFRSQVYTQNLRKINAHNAQRTRKYTMGLNQFTDLLEEEFIAQYAQLVIPQNIINDANRINTQPQGPSPTLPRIVVDWQCHSKSVFQQGRCGASNVISVLESIEIGYKTFSDVSLSELQNLSVQEILSCVNQTRYPDQLRCQGGFFEGAYRYVMQEDIGRATYYSYSPSSLYAGVTPPCDTRIKDSPTYNLSKRGILFYSKVPYNSCANLLESLEFRPIVAAIYARNLQFYRQGVFTSEIPEPYTTTGWQGVTILGYDPTNKFKIKNSWGTSWGIRGFGYADQTTGLCKFASYPITGMEISTIASPKCCNPISLLSLI